MITDYNLWLAFLAIYTERVVNMAKAENYQPVQQLGLF